MAASLKEAQHRLASHSTCVSKALQPAAASRFPAICSRESRSAESFLGLAEIATNVFPACLLCFQLYIPGRQIHLLGACYFFRRSPFSQARQHSPHLVAACFNFPAADASA